MSERKLILIELVHTKTSKRERSVLLATLIGGEVVVRSEVGLPNGLGVDFRRLAYVSGFDGAWNNRKVEELSSE